MNLRKKVMIEIAALDKLRITQQSQLNENKRYLTKDLHDNSLIFLMMLASSFWVGWKNGRPSHVSGFLKQVEKFLVLTIMANIKKNIGLI